MHSRPVNEIEELQTQEDFPDAVTVGEFNRQRKESRGRYEGGHVCRGALVCYKCGKGSIFYRSIFRKKNPAQSSFTKPPAGSARK